MLIRSPPDNSAQQIKPVPVLAYENSKEHCHEYTERTQRVHQETYQLGRKARKQQSDKE